MVNILIKSQNQKVIKDNLIQKYYRKFLFIKKQKDIILYKLITYKNEPAQLIRIRQINFQSLT